MMSRDERDVAYVMIADRSASALRPAADDPNRTATPPDVVPPTLRPIEPGAWEGSHPCARWVRCRTPRRRPDNMHESEAHVLGLRPVAACLRLCSQNLSPTSFASSAPGLPRNTNAGTMKKTASAPRRRPRRPAPDDILPEYDFTHATPNPYAARFREGVTVVAIDADVARVFRTADEVNGALRALAAIIRQHTNRASRKRKRA